MNAKSQQVNRIPPAKPQRTRRDAVTHVRGVAGNHVLMRKERAASELEELDEMKKKKQGGCACGGSSGGPCGPCSSNGGVKLRRAESNGRRVKSVPPIVHEVLRSSGRPLDSATRAFMEPRFGRDFGEVRVHTDQKAAESARQVNAFAFTVGTHVVFGKGQFAPHATSGKRLLAHELAHTIQQSQVNTFQPNIGIVAQTDPSEVAADHAADAIVSGGSLPPLLAATHGIHRFASCGTTTDCPARDSGETERARRDPMIVGELSNGVTGMFVGNFAIGSSTLKSDLRRNRVWDDFKRRMAADTSVDWELLGFTDCEGTEARNQTLREARTASVFSDLPLAGRSRVTSRRGAPMTDCIAENSSEQGRTFNRSVLFNRIESRYDFPDETVPTLRCDRVATASTFSEYVHLVLCAERALPTYTPRQMLSLLRQLYYSPQSWSVCTGAGCQFWTDVIPCGLTIPDPQPALGTALFTALRNSKLVEGVDMGHVFTGLESMFCPRTSVDLNVPGPNWTVNIANYEFATWAGDLGSAVAAKVHHEQDQGMRTQPWSRYFLTPRTLASEEDLLGDIDAYVLRAGLSGSTCGASPSHTLTTLSGPISEILHNYYEIPSSAPASRANRFACFIEALGGTVSGNRITGGRTGLTHRVAIRTGEFAENFYRLSYHRGYFATPGIGSWIVLYRDQIADRFVTWLESNL